MWKIIKVIIFIAYILYGLNFMDKEARANGVVGALLSLIVFVVFGIAIFNGLWVYKDEGTKKKNDNMNKF